MTDKQIIIDGIDVSRCSYFTFTDEHYCEECSSEFGCAICDERTICYYKQLVRKEQECEKYKQTLTEIKDIAEYCYDPVDKENDGFWSILQKISECEAEEQC